MGNKQQPNYKQTAASLLFFLCLPITFLFAQKGHLIAKDSSLVPIDVLKKHTLANSTGTHKADYLAILENGKEKIVHPKEVVGFTLGKKIYKSLEIKMDKGSTFLFAEQLQMGTATLFYYGGYAFGEPEIYIFRKGGEGYHYISLEPKVISQNQGNAQANNPSTFDLTMQREINILLDNWSDERMFKAQFLRYFSDCKQVVNKLKQDWYTPTMISDMFREYNTNCTSK